ncbi:MAG: hypothetical protein IJ379_10170 [Lachnospiraceae bacterium]|nr:hypothetical protein [Lachnospiraceae bacterium]
MMIVGMILGCSAVVRAQEDSGVTMSGIVYDTEECVIGETPYSIAELFVSDDNVIIQKAGASEFIDVYGFDLEGAKHYVSEYAIWTSSNNEVVFADRGRLLAQGKGNAEVTVSYGTDECVIQVTVEENVNYEELLANAISTCDMTNEQRLRYVANANAMVAYSWTPTSTLTGWRGNYAFVAGTTYHGIPYSQTEYQTDLDEFISSLNQADFYSSYTSGGVVMPKYGNDCSGFVSFAYELPRQNTTQLLYSLRNGAYKRIGSYDADNPTYNELMSSYPYMTAGDALVKQGHAMFVASNMSDENYCIMYEQTPGYARTTQWTYTELAEDGYMPFSK